MGLLDGDIADAIADGFDGLLLTGTLTKFTATGRDADGDTITTPTPYACQGVIENYDGVYRVQAQIPETDVRVLLIAGLTASVPAIGDTITMSGRNYRVRKVSRDPASATYDCQSYLTS